MTKPTKPTRPSATASAKPAKPTPAKKIPSYLSEAFNLVQPGKSNHLSAKNAMNGKRPRNR